MTMDLLYKNMPNRLLRVSRVCRLEYIKRSKKYGELQELFATHIQVTPKSPQGSNFDWAMKNGLHYISLSDILHLFISGRSTAPINEEMAIAFIKKESPSLYNKLQASFDLKISGGTSPYYLNLYLSEESTLEEGVANRTLNIFRAASDYVRNEYHKREQKQDAIHLALESLPTTVVKTPSGSRYKTSGEINGLNTVKSSMTSAIVTGSNSFLPESSVLEFLSGSFPEAYTALGDIIDMKVCDRELVGNLPTELIRVA